VVWQRDGDVGAFRGQTLLTIRRCLKVSGQNFASLYLFRTGFRNFSLLTAYFTGYVLYDYYVWR